MISVDQALDCLAEQLSAGPSENSAGSAALGRVLAEPIQAQIDLPPFTQSAMDGYAVRRDSLRTAPRELRIAQRLPAGDTQAPAALDPDSCARVFTGGRIPSNADAVVMQEDVQASDDNAHFASCPAAQTHIRQRGEECSAGTELLAAGQRLGSQDLALASMAGVSSLRTVVAPRIAVFVTGDELVAPGLALQDGQVYESNGGFLQAWCAERRCATSSEHVFDDAATLSNKLEVSDAELILVTGGASVGDYDYGRQAAVQAGFSEQFWRVAQKPGKPLYFGMRGRQALLILPGNPGSVFVCTQIYVQRVLDLLEGVLRPNPQFRLGRLVTAVSADTRRERLLRVIAAPAADSAEIQLQALDGQASHMLSNLAQANALLRVPAGQNLPAGALGHYVLTR